MSQCANDECCSYNELNNKYSNLKKLYYDLQMEIKKNERDSRDKKNCYLNEIRECQHMFEEQKRLACARDAEVCSMQSDLAVLADELKRLNDQNARLECENQKLSGKYCAKKSERDDLECNYQKVSGELCTKTVERNALADECENLRRQLDDRDHCLRKRREENARLSETICERDRVIEDRARCIQELKCTLLAQERRLDETNALKEHCDCKSEALTARIAELECSLKAEADANCEKTRTIGCLEEKVGRLQSVVNGTCCEKELLEQNIDCLNVDRCDVERKFSAEIDRLNRCIEALNCQVAAERSEKECCQDRLKRCENENECLRKDLESLRCAVRNKGDQLQCCKDKNVDLEKSRLACHMELSCSRDKENKLMNRVHEATRENDQQKKQIVRLMETVNTLTCKLDKLEREHCELKNCSRRLEKENCALVTRVSDLNEQLECMTKKECDCRAKLNACVNERSILNEKPCACTEEKKCVRTELERTREKLCCLERDLQKAEIGEVTRQKDAIDRMYSELKPETKTCPTTCCKLVDECDCRRKMCADTCCKTVGECGCRWKTCPAACCKAGCDSEWKPNDFGKQPVQSVCTAKFDVQCQTDFPANDTCCRMKEECGCRGTSRRPAAGTDVERKPVKPTYCSVGVQCETAEVPAKIRPTAVYIVEKQPENPVCMNNAQCQTDMTEKQLKCTMSVIEQLTVINNKLVAENKECLKVVNDLKEDENKLTSENRALKKSFEKYKTKYACCRAAKTATSHDHRRHSTHGRNGCDKCDSSGGASCDRHRRQESVSCECWKTAGSSNTDRMECECAVADFLPKTKLLNELTEMKKMFEEKEKCHRRVLNDMSRRHSDNEQKLRNEMAELTLKYHHEMEVYGDYIQECDHKILSLEKKLKESLKRGKELETRNKNLEKKIEDKDQLLEYEKNNVLNLRERKNKMDCLQKSLESEKDKRIKAEERIKTFAEQFVYFFNKQKELEKMKSDSSGAVNEHNKRKNAARNGKPAGKRFNVDMSKLPCCTGTVPSCNRYDLSENQSSKQMFHAPNGHRLPVGEDSAGTTGDDGNDDRSEQMKLLGDYGHKMVYDLAKYLKTCQSAEEPVDCSREPSADAVRDEERRRVSCNASDEVKSKRCHATKTAQPLPSADTFNRQCGDKANNKSTGFRNKLECLKKVKKQQGCQGK